MLVAQPAFADVTAEYRFGAFESSSEITCTIEVSEGGEARIQSPNANAYVLLKGKAFYHVMKVPGGVVTVPDRAMLAAQREFGPDHQAVTMEQDKWMEHGPIEIEGRNGIAWSYVLTIPPEGVPRFPELVLSDEVELAPLGKVFLAAQERGGAALLPCLFQTPKYRLPQAMETRAPLVIDPLRLVRASTEPIPADRFELPSDPISTEEWLAIAAPFPAAPALSQDQDEATAPPRH